MNEFMNGMMGGLGFMNGVGLYNAAFMNGYQNQMTKNHQVSEEDLLLARVDDILNNIDKYKAESGFSEKEICHLLVDDLQKQNNYSLDYIKDKIRKNYSPVYWYLFWDEKDAWKVYTE